MRIISGKKRGKNLVSPAHLPLRPTSNKVREAIFNMFRMSIPDCFFLDLFAGTGAIGLNALSEGAKGVTFVEKNPVCLRIIKKNINHSDLSSERITLFRETAERFLLHRKLDPYHFIFLDPPYSYTIDQYLYLLQKIQKKMNNNATIILEHEKKNEMQFIAEALKLQYEERTYGRTKISIFRIE